ncbi:hypothetical protein [Lutibacter sp.]
MKCKISNIKLIKYLNKELSEAESRQVELQISNSENCLQLLNELKATYGLVNTFPKLKENPNLYLNVINKVSETPKNIPILETKTIPIYGIVRPILLAASILIAILSGVFIGGKFTAQSNIEMATTLNSEFYINALQLESIENYLME